VIPDATALQVKKRKKAQGKDEKQDEAEVQEAAAKEQELRGLQISHTAQLQGRQAQIRRPALH